MDINSIPGLRRKGKAAENANISVVENYFNSIFPDEYRQLLKVNNGAAGSLIQLYSTEELIEINEIYEVKKYAPGFICIGDDGGGRAIMIELNANITPVYIVDHGSMMPEDMEKLAPSLGEWLENQCPLK